ncbi:hypothetical protein V5F77_05410 [Xanthobacter sp. DSM 24535]|uniref:hypothetical protein n=1 Tax=Roseixanthobacter psychrophilus TaxID=3119917 RepID=UPI0037290A08
MSSPAAIQATYSDLKIVKGRKVAQIICEIPLEQAEAFVAAFGMPLGATETWVAIARLDLNAPASAPVAEKPSDAEKPRKRWEDLPLPQQAAIRCEEEAFRNFLGEKYAVFNHANSAAEYVRKYCGVNSRADIGGTTDSAREWKRLESYYQFWLRNAA